MVVREQRSFERKSPVASYWLSRCEGFRVHAGRRSLGIVEQIGCSEPTGGAEVLVIRAGRKRRVLPTDKVAAVIPARKSLLVDAPPRARTRTRASALRSVATLSSFLLLLLGHSVAAARRHGPQLARFSRLAGDRTLAAAAFAARATATACRRSGVAWRERVSPGLRRLAKRGAAARQRAVVHARPIPRRVLAATRRGSGRALRRPAGHAESTTPSSPRG